MMTDQTDQVLLLIPTRTFLHTFKLSWGLVGLGSGLSVSSSSFPGNNEVEDDILTTYILIDFEFNSNFTAESFFIKTLSENTT